MNVATGAATVRHGKPAKGADVVSLAFGRSRSELIVAKKNGSVLVLVDYVAAVTVSGFTADVAGAEMVETGDNEQSLLCVDVNGKGYLLRQEEVGDVDVSTRAVSLQLSKPVERIAVHRSLVAVGGNDNRLRIWDLRTGEKVFEARNPPDDWLCLKVPMWISGLAFSSAEDVTRVAIATRHRDVQLFDTAPKYDRRPVWRVTVGADPLNCVVFSKDNAKLFCGSATGFVYVLNAEDGSLLGRMAPSCAGSVRDIACVGNELLLAVGLDRFLYGYKQAARTMPHKVYAKQRLCRVLVLQEGLKEGEEEGDDDDDAWFGLAAKEGKEEEKPIKKKREAIAEETPSNSIGRALDKLKSKKLKRRR